MSYIQGSHRAQLQMLCIEDCVSQRSPCRVVDAFVDYLDLEGLAFKIKGNKRTGRPAYQLEHMLKLYLYGYLNRVRSSRRLQRECETNLEAMWLLEGLRPCYKTISDFRKDNPKGLKSVFRQLNVFLKGEDLFQGDTVAIDGSKFRAQNSKKNNYNARKVEQQLNYIDKQTDKWLEELDTVDQLEDTEIKEEQLMDIDERLNDLHQRRNKYESISKELESVKESGQRQVSSVDKDARALPKHMNIVEVGYNIQSTVESEDKLIVDFEVTNENDTYALSRNAIRAKELLGKERLKVLADKGYDTGHELKKCAENDIETYVCPRQKNGSTKAPKYRKDKFDYDHDSDCYTCPNGEKLISNGRWYQKKKATNNRPAYEVKIYKTRYEICNACPFREACAGVANLNNSKGRVIERSAYDDYLEDNRERVKLNKSLYRERQAIVEHPFGTIKRQWGYDYTLLRTKQKVEGEFSLIFTAYNLRRAMSIFGVKSLIERLKKAFLVLLTIFTTLSLVSALKTT